MKCRQRVCRPLGGISPLSDRAPRNNGDAGKPSEYSEAKATSELSLRVLATPGSKSMACRYSKRRNLGEPEGDDHK